MELNIAEAARLLKVSVQTIHRLIHNESLPARRNGDLYQFNRVELEEWSRRRDREAPLVGLTAKPSLRRALRQGGVHLDLEASDRDAALRALARLPDSRVALDEEALYEVLRKREELAPTTVGNGFAIPHPRDAAVAGVELEYAYLCRFREPVPFGALDGQPIHTALLLLSPDTEKHLQLLALASLALRDQRFCELVRRADKPAAVLARIDQMMEPIEQRRR